MKLRQLSRFCADLGIRYPVLQAPMSGANISTAELVAAVSEAGGMGSVGAAYLTPEEIRQTIRRVRELTNKKFSFNLFAGGPDGQGSSQIEPMLEVLRPIHAELGLTAPEPPGPNPYVFEEQLQTLFDEKIEIISFTFGIPDEKYIDEFKRRSIYWMGTATNAQEAKALEDAGADAIIAQAYEAGGHRGAFLQLAEESLIGAMVLIPQVVDVVSRPVIAAGGIMDGRGITAAFALGASAVALGTAFITTTECGAAACYKDALLNKRQRRSVLTRMYSGRLARGLSNKFAEMEKTQRANIASFPVQNDLTRKMRAESTKKNNIEYISLWAGQNFQATRKISATQLFNDLLAETRQTISDLAEFVNLLADN
jgi:nitronate monooxygenase